MASYLEPARKVAGISHRAARGRPISLSLSLSFPTCLDSGPLSGTPERHGIHVSSRPCTHRLAVLPVSRLRGRQNRIGLAPLRLPMTGCVCSRQGCWALQALSNPRQRRRVQKVRRPGKRWVRVWVLDGSGDMAVGSAVWVAFSTNPCYLRYTILPQRLSSS